MLQAYSGFSFTMQQGKTNAEVSDDPCPLGFSFSPVKALLINIATSL